MGKNKEITRTGEIVKEISALYEKIGISIEAAQGYIAGIIDGEGSVFRNRKKAYVSVGSTDTDIIFRIIECLEVLDIRYSIYVIRNKTITGKDFYNITIPRRQVNKLISFPFGCIRKVKKIKEVIETTRPIEYKKSYISEEEWDRLLEEDLGEWSKRNRVHKETAARWKRETKK
jgi:hypothetical protein